MTLASAIQSLQTCQLPKTMDTLTRPSLGDVDRTCVDSSYVDSTYVDSTSIGMKECVHWDTYHQGAWAARNVQWEHHPYSVDRN